jgi:hypothetical protein
MTGRAGYFRQIAEANPGLREDWLKVDDELAELPERRQRGVETHALAAAWGVIAGDFTKDEVDSASAAGRDVLAAFLVDRGRITSEGALITT